MSNEWDRRGNIDGGGRGGSTVSRGSKPGGGTLAGNRYAGVAPPQSDSTAAPVQRKNLFASLPGLEENQPVRDDDPLDFTTLYSPQLGATAVTTPIQRRQSLEPATDPVHDRGPMLSLFSAPVQRRASMSAIDAPRAASLGAERTTIDASSSAATEAPASASSAAASSEQSDEVDAPKADSLREDRATIGADDGPAGQGGELEASKADSLSEDRATIAPDAEAAAGPLSPARARRAAARNTSRVARHGISPADLGTDAAPDSAAFAQAVAGFQQQHGLAVDGIVGPATAAAVRDSAGAQTEPEVAAAGGPAADSSAGADIDARGAGSSLLQMKAAPGAGSDEDVHRAARAGIASGGQSLPHLERIQTAFGAHDVTGVQAHVGGAAAGASEAMGAEAYATGNHVAFKQSPDLHTAAHEAAHVVQQRGGVQLKGGVGQAGDSYEQHADAVADKVVRGESAEAMLGGAGTTRRGEQKAGATANHESERDLVPAATRASEPAVQREGVRGQGTAVAVNHPQVAEDLVFITDCINQALSQVQNLLRDDDTSSHIPILQGANSQLRQPLWDTARSMSATGLTFALAHAPELHRMRAAVDRFLGWATYDSGGVVIEPFTRTQVLANQILTAARLPVVDGARRTPSRTEAANIEGHCQAIAHKYHWLCRRQRDAVADLYQESELVDPPSIGDQIVFAALQMASGFALGAIGASVSAGAKAYLASHKPQLDSIDAGFIADLMKEGTKVFVKGAATEAFRHYAEARDPRQMFFQSQRDALGAAAEQMQSEFLLIGRQELLRTRDPLSNAKALLATLEQHKEKAYQIQRNTTLEQWCVAMAKGSVGTHDAFATGEHDGGANLGNKAGHANPLTTSEQLLKGDGTLDIRIHVNRPGDVPEVQWAYVGGLNRQLREWLGARPIGELDIPIVVRGTTGPDAGHPAAPKIWVARNTARTVWVSPGTGVAVTRKGLAWLNARGGGEGDSLEGALAGARRLIEEDMPSLSVAGKFRT